MHKLRTFFWALALAVIAAYPFFRALGGFAFDEVVPVSLLVVALALLWALHAWLERRRDARARDSLLVRARERRGF